jgi:hypothetical protein
MQAVINRLNANINNRVYDMLTIVNGAEVDQQPPIRRIRILPNTTQAILQQRVGPNWQPVPGVAAVTQAQVTQFVNIIQRSFTDGQHRQVLQNAEWRALYHVAPRVLTYLGVNGAPLLPAPMGDTVPCRDCGLVLPFSNIDIDHQRPVAGNDLEPVCKVFRAMGLTQGAPTGRKGLHVNPAYSALVGGLPGAAAGLNAKYTLNDVGQIYYTLVNWAGRSLIMQERCRNHIINLRPLCGSCNSPNRNVRHF